MAVNYLSEKIRITSTYVENTDGCELFIRKDKDHLHIRGEYLGLKPNSLPIAGSPPHTWRIRRFTWIQNPTTRITSTYVENTDQWFLILTNWKDHLHIRGEYISNLNTWRLPLGSPPHTWRIPYDEQLLIPAGRDHLHIRGEYSKQIPL